MYFHTGHLYPLLGPDGQTFRLSRLGFSSRRASPQIATPPPIPVSHAAKSVAPGAESTLDRMLREGFFTSVSL